MDIERLKELKDYLRVANELSILNDDNLMQRIVDNNDVTNTIDIAIELLNAEIARQSVTDDAVQRAIEWQEAEKESAQTDFERSDADWRMEYGVKETHDERMAAFDLAIQALRQMRKPENDIPNVIQDLKH